MFSKNLEQSIHRAFLLAQKHRHEFLTPEHLLHSLTKDGEALPIFKACQVSIRELRKILDTYMEKYIEPLEYPPQEVTATLGFSRLMERASTLVTASGRRELDSGNVLVALLEEEDSFAANCLETLGATRFKVVQYLTDMRSSPMSGPPSSTGAPASSEEEGPAPSALALYCVNLNELAASRKLDPLIGRNQELARCYEILARRRKNNPLLLGDPGVGKTAIATGLAAQIEAKVAPSFLHGSTVYALNPGALLAGSRYRGEFEERIHALVTELKTQKAPILFIDELHSLMGAGAISGGGLDAATLLKPILSDGSLRCLGTTTHADYRQHMEKDRALIRRFQTLDVDEPSREATLEILKGLAPRYEAHHKVTFGPKILEAVIDLTTRYMHDRRLPDKALDLLDEVGARHRLKTPGKRAVTMSEVEEVTSTLIKAPLATVTLDDRDRLKNLEAHLKEVIFGQDPAITRIARAIKLARSGLKDPQKPQGSFLFAGPTGVGKTELARQLAQQLGIQFVRFDMSEYMEKHAVSKLVGAPPGYVGFDQGGLLTDVISEKPYCVLLLDEVEKAHPDLMNILLQVMDYGRLKDHRGKEVDFRHVVLILTTNAGAQDLERHPLGFSKTHGDHDLEGALKHVFSPEFRNRLDSMIAFAPLTPPAMIQVVEKFLNQLDALLLPKRVTLFVDDNARGWLAQRGYDPTLGARPLERLIQETLKHPLSDEILFGKLKKGGLVRVTVENDSLSFTYPAVGRN